MKHRRIQNLPDYANLALTASSLKNATYNAVITQ